MKIDEPKTPYVRPEDIPDSPTDELDLESEAAKRMSVSSMSEGAGWESTSEGEGLGADEDDPHGEFEAHRMQHYDMRAALKKAKRLLAEEAELGGSEAPPLDA